MSLSAPFLMPLPPPYGIPSNISLTEKYQPREIADFVGLVKIRKQLAAYVRNPRAVGGLLFSGKAGCGKSSMALALARALNAEVHLIPARTCDLATITSVRYSCNFYPMAGYKSHMVLVEEADLMSQAAQDYLLSELDGIDATPMTKFVFTCNDTSGLDRRFLTRNLKFDFSTQGDAPLMAEHLARIWDEETGNAQPLPNFARIVKESNSSIREALQSLEMEVMAL